MARRHPSLPGWGQLSTPIPRRPRRGGLARWVWPALAVGSFLVVVRYALDRDQVLTIRGGLTIALAAVVLGVLTVRCRRGGLARTVAEYAAVVFLAMFLAQPSPPTPKPKPTRDRPALAVVTETPGNVRDWLVDAWQRAGQETDQRTSSAPPPDAKEAP